MTDEQQLERWLDDQVQAMSLPAAQRDRLRELLRDPQGAPAQLFELGRSWQRIIELGRVVDLVDP